ncbi:type II toxin-antitoxin system HigB family toxin [Desulfobacterium sp. N47]|uniref:Uncharacterized protein n=1 Tax=uncultured Desulfobacterium sp. TaxID=201089 RepID=E1YJU7_9BACT|nr:unknown protein [uncultured Desulfobacterium sp.]
MISSNKISTQQIQYEKLPLEVKNLADRKFLLFRCQPFHLIRLSLIGLIAAIHYNTRRIYIRHVLTHKEYDRGYWRK